MTMVANRPIEWFAPSLMRGDLPGPFRETLMPPETFADRPYWWDGRTRALARGLADYCVDPHDGAILPAIVGPIDLRIYGDDAARFGRLGCGCMLGDAATPREEALYADVFAWVEAGLPARQQWPAYDFPPEWRAKYGAPTVADWRAVHGALQLAWETLKAAGKQPDPFALHEISNVGEVVARLEAGGSVTAAGGATNGAAGGMSTGARVAVGVVVVGAIVGGLAWLGGSP